MTILGKSKRTSDLGNAIRDGRLVASGERHFKQSGFTHILKRPGNFQRDMDLHYGGAAEDPRAPWFVRSHGKVDALRAVVAPKGNKGNGRPLRSASIGG